MNTPKQTQEYLEKLLNERESEYLEFKKSKGGLPNSLWETYSAFANTHGGLIVLGIEEKPDQTLRLAGLTLQDVESLKQELFRQLHNKQKVNTCLLTDKDVSIEVVEKRYILFIQVPRASREQRPVYIRKRPRAR